ncbi:MAG: response regulator [Verrucomicrobia bacterium]|nr:response regulator [Verrucomicrobiota bacterium]
MNTSKTIHVLIIDDDRHLRITMQDFLEGDGFRVSTARSAEEALAMLPTAAPDLAVLDISMSGMGGLGYLKAVVNQAGQRPHPVLVLTARSAMESFFEDPMADGFLVKPVSGIELAAKIRDIIDRRRDPMQRGEADRRRVLLIEDHAIPAHRLSVALRAAGYQVDLIENAFDLFKNKDNRPDVIVSREVLPTIKGSSVAIMADGHRRTHGIPFVLYDSTHRIEHDLFQGATSPPGVARLVLTDDAGAIVDAVQGVLTGRG